VILEVRGKSFLTNESATLAGEILSFLDCWVGEEVYHLIKGISFGLWVNEGSRPYMLQHMVESLIKECDFFKRLQGMLEDKCLFLL